MADGHRARKLGIAISGGGHRATAWALGALLYLVDVGANRDVGAIASVSGGSLANAFVATGPVSFRDVKRQDERFAHDVAALARAIAGRPVVWWSLVAASVLVNLVAVALLAVQGWGAWPLVGALWLGWLVVAALVGPRAGGTLWSSPVMWVYMGVLVPLLAAVVSLWWWDAWWGWRALAFTGALLGWLILLAQRGAVVGLAFSRSVRKLDRKPGGGSRHLRLADIDGDVQHVFCATEMHAGQHAYFSADFVYSKGFGIGVPGDLKLHTAVQASANLPGAFPLRLLRASRFDFVLGRQGERNKWLVLTDGGVFDNMGDSWFLDLEHRTRDLESLLYSARRVTKPDQPVLMRGHEDDLRDRVQAMKSAFPVGRQAPSDGSPPPGALIVLNGAPAERWTRLDQVWLPALGELLGFAKVAKVQYNNSTSTRSRELVARFERHEPEGVLVTIEEDPSWVPQQMFDAAINDAYYSCPPDMDDDFLNIMSADIGDDDKTFEAATSLVERVPNDNLDEEYQKLLLGRMRRARDAVDHLRTHALRVGGEDGLPQSLRSLSMRNRAIGTHLNPLGRERTARLLFHAYVQAMATLHTAFGERFALLGPKHAALRRFERLLEAPGPSEEPPAPVPETDDEAPAPEPSYRVPLAATVEPRRPAES